MMDNPRYFEYEAASSAHLEVLARFGSQKALEELRHRGIEPRWR